MVPPCPRASILVLCALSISLAVAAPPGEVPPTATFGPDGSTLNWSTVSGATSYNIYRGTSPEGYNQACRILRTGQTSALLAETPTAPGGLVYFLVSAVNADGEGALGRASDGSPRPNRAPCADADGDLVADNLDNCPTAANPNQADQDLNGVGDACDPCTYDFEADALGGRPAGMTKQGSGAQSLTVKNYAGDHGISYDLAGVGVQDRFDRLLQGAEHQNATVYVDVDPGAATASVELWSDGAWGWNAGSGVILQAGSGGNLTFYDRVGQSVPSIAGPPAPVDGRMRLRLVKGPGVTSTLYVDSWSGTSWTPYASFPVADDHRYRGLGTTLADYFAPTRGILRITVVPELPPAPLTVRKDPSWSSDWKVFQRDGSDQASVPLRFYYRSSAAAHVQARIVRSANGAVLPGHDWADHQMSLASAPAGAGAEMSLAGVPAGGNYDVEVRLLRDSDNEVLGADLLDQIAVGDVFLAGGQSNMSGYSGSLDNAETPIDEVHLFHNDYTWKRALEPMDDGADQVDLVSAESPQHTLMLRFGKEIFEATGVPVGIIPGPLGGTNLYSQWQRDEADHQDRGTLYGSLLHRGLLQNYSTPLKGFLWYQGESDAGRGVALYKADLERLMAECREDLENPGLVFGIVQLATYGQANLTTWLPIQEAQREVVEEDPLSVLSAAVDLPRADTIHLNVAGYKTLGARLAAEMREHFYGQPIDASARLSQARVVAGGGAIELVYDAAVTGGASLYRVTDSSGARTITSMTVSGTVVTLNVQGRLRTGATVSYGYANSPGAPWVKDANGAAVACFENVSASP